MTDFILLPGEEKGFKPNLCECGWPVHYEYNYFEKRDELICNNPFCSEVLIKENEFLTIQLN